MSIERIEEKIVTGIYLFPEENVDDLLGGNRPEFPESAGPYADGRWTSRGGGPAAARPDAKGPSRVPAEGSSRRSTPPSTPIQIIIMNYVNSRRGGFRVRPGPLPSDRPASLPVSLINQLERESQLNFRKISVFAPTPDPPIVTQWLRLCFLPAGHQLISENVPSDRLLRPRSIIYT